MLSCGLKIGVGETLELARDYPRWVMERCATTVPKSEGRTGIQCSVHVGDKAHLVTFC